MVEYECPICHKKYKDEGWFRRHINVEHEGVIFCDNCQTVTPASLYCVNCGRPLK